MTLSLSGSYVPPKEPSSPDSMDDFEPPSKRKRVASKFKRSKPAIPSDSSDLRPPKGTARKVDKSKSTVSLKSSKSKTTEKLMSKSKSSSPSGIY